MNQLVGSYVCFTKTVWYTLRYPSTGLFGGYILSGHDFKYNGEVHGDHWHMVCKRCGVRAGTDVKPEETDV